MASDVGRGQGIARTLRITAALLQGRELTVEDVMDLLGIKLAGAKRQLKQLERELAGVGLEVHNRARGRVYSLARTEEASKRPTVGTAIAACFSSTLAPLFADTSIGVAMRNATKAIVDRAKRTVSSRDVDRKFFFHARGGEFALPAQANMLTTIVHALLDCKWLRLCYQHFDGDDEKLDVKPYSIVVHEHQLYVVASNKKRPLHPYRFARMSSAELLDKRFEYPSRAEYEPERAFRNSIGIFLDPAITVVDVVVRLAPRWTTYVTTHRWHHSQTVEHDEAGLIVRLHVRGCSELERWVLAFGDDAEVLEPAALRAKISERLAAAAAKYRASS